MKHLRVSYSTLYAMKRGDQDRAWAAYWHLEHQLPEDIQALIDAGKNAHEKWESQIIKSGVLPAEFANPFIKEVSSEHKFEKDFLLADDITVTLVGVIDAYKSIDTVDFKFSRGDAAKWINTEQGGVYQLLRPEATRFWIFAKHPDTGQVTRGVRHLTKATAKDGLQFVYTWTLEMIRVFGVDALDRSETDNLNFSAGLEPVAVNAKGGAHESN